jgi:guanine nucleotide-binding protein subunit alpha
VSDVSLADDSFFDSMQRLAAPDYMPTDQDILRARVKTTGITCGIKSLISS